MTTRSNESNNILDSTTKVTEVKRNFGASFLRHDNGIIRNTTGLKISHSRLSELASATEDLCQTYL